MDTLQAITTRYACRDYTSQQLTREQTELLIQAANAAPAASCDFSTVKLTVVQDEGLCAEIDQAAAFSLPPLKEHPTFGAPTLVLLSVKPNEAVPAVPWCNASCMAENIMVAANALGLASVFLMGVPTALRQKRGLLEKLHITDGFVPAIVVAVGYARQPTAEHKPMRVLVERL